MDLLGGKLARLPGTAVECRQAERAFGSGQVKVLEGPDATEQNVRAAIRGRRIVHLAAHGLLDESHENLFGAIALTPPPPGAGSPDNDGFLMLHEVHTLPLAGCELAVLSACQTNVGPERPLEAGSTLAQAFLTAGAKRVVSSHWNVADASTAELMGKFFEEVARSLKQGEPVNYALALKRARKHIQSIDPWSSPYYWAPFVLIGPAQ